MNNEFRYVGNPYKKHNMPIDDFLDVLFAVNAGMDTVAKVSKKTRRNHAATSQLVMMLVRQSFLVRHGVGSAATFKITQRAQMLMQKAIEVEKDLGLIGENRWGIELLV
jgi:hypothetical protein